MSRRDLIKMTDDEATEFLNGRHTMNVATIGRDGRPHLVAMWYGFTPDGSLAWWTYGKSQKVLNVQRDPRITCLVESGDSYDQLRGVEIVGDAVVLEDRESVMAVGRSVFERYTGPWTDAAGDAVAQMGAKRVAVRIDVEKLVTWDHTKLGGVY